MVIDDNMQRVPSLLQSAVRICCICHAGPDGDAVGSLVAMKGLLKRAYPDTPVRLWCNDSVPEAFLFLPDAQSISQPNVVEEGDVFIALDCAESKLTRLQDSHPEIFRGEHPLINIDHHPTNTNFGTVNIVDAECSSTCELILRLADQFGWEVDAKVATALLTGIYTDTGGLLHSNTTAAVYQSVARLLRLGANRHALVEHVFRTSKLSTLRLWGRVLEKISLTDDGGAISAVTAGDFRSANADFSELTGAIDYVNAVPGMRFSLILSQRGDTVKGSLRTLRDDVDVAAMAQKFEGGGHKKAAGFSIDGTLEPEVRWKVTSAHRESHRVGTKEQLLPESK